MMDKNCLKTSNFKIIYSLTYVSKEKNILQRYMYHTAVNFIIQLSNNKSFRIQTVLKCIDFQKYF